MALRAKKPSPEELEMLAALLSEAPDPAYAEPGPYLEQEVQDTPRIGLQPSRIPTGDTSGLQDSMLKAASIYGKGGGATDLGSGGGAAAPTELNQFGGSTSVDWGGAGAGAGASGGAGGAGGFGGWGSAADWGFGSGAGAGAGGGAGGGSGAGGLGPILAYVLAGSYLQNLQDSEVKRGSTGDKLMEGFLTPNLSQGILAGRPLAHIPGIGPWLEKDKGDEESDGGKLLGFLGFPKF